MEDGKMGTRIPKRVYTAQYREAAVRQVIDAGHSAAHVRPYGKHVLIQMHRDDTVETVARLTEVSRHRYTAAFRSHTGRWELLPSPAADLKQTADLVATLLAPYLEP